MDNPYVPFPMGPSFGMADGLYGPDANADRDGHVEIPKVEIPVVGAKDRIHDIKDRILQVLEKLPRGVQGLIKERIERQDFFGLFRLIEDLIASRELDDVMREDQEFRKFLASVYRLRHPRLDLDDVGRAIEEEGAELDWHERQRQREAFARTDGPAKVHHRQILLLEAHRAKQRELGIPLPPLPEKPFNPIPMAPSKGGPAPREAFTSRWTYRRPAGRKKFIVDPRRTCEDFLPPLAPVDQDSRIDRDGPRGQGIDKSLMDSLLARLQDVSAVIGEQRESSEVASMAVTMGELAPKAPGKETDPNAEYDPDNIEYEDPPVEVFRQLMLSDWAARGEPRASFTLEEAAALQQKMVKAREESRLPRPPPPPGTTKRPWEERYLALVARARAPWPSYPIDDIDTGMTGIYDEPKAPPPRHPVIVEKPTGKTDKGTEGTEGTNVTNVTKGTKGTDGAGKLLPPKNPRHVDALTEDMNAPAPGIYDPDWLVNSLARSSDLASEDLDMFEYRGWRIHSPKVQLIRIKNFLADEDVDRTLGWRAHFDEIAAFLKHLYDEVWDGSQTWSLDLLEAISMLQTHDLFETRAYGRQRPVVHFELPVFRQRLRAHADAPGMGAIADDAAPGTRAAPMAADETLAPRYLIHRVPESIHDVDYQVSGKLLRTRFLQWYRDDASRVALRDPDAEGTAGSGARGRRLANYGYTPDFNMVEVEDETFNKCIEGGTNETAFALQERCNFTLQKEQLVLTEDGSTWPDGTAAREFAMFRGAKRAALQFCLRHFEAGVVNSDLVTPFRKLVMPIPWREKERLRAEARRKIFFRPLALAEPPKNACLDPYAWNHWHDALIESHDRKARTEAWTCHLRYVGAALHGEQTPETIPVLTSANMNGPYVHSFLAQRNDDYRVALKELAALNDKLKSVQAKTPRPLLAAILDHVGMGFDAAEADNFDMQDLDTTILTEFRRLNSSSASYASEPIQAKPIDERGLWWLRFILDTPSTTRRQLREAGLRDEVARTQPVFVHRLQMLLDNADPKGFMASDDVRDWREVPEIVAAINQLGHGGDVTRSAVFTPEVTGYVCDLLAECGVLDRQSLAGTGRVFYRRALCDLHPEERINWFARDMFDDDGKPLAADGELPLGVFPPENRVLDWIAAAAAGLDDSANLAGASGPSLADRVSFSFRLLGFRMGYWIRKTRAIVYDAYSRLEAAGLGTAWSAEVDDHLRRSDGLLAEWRHRCTIYRPDEPVTYSAVVKAADPAKWTRAMAGEAYHEDAVELVRANKARELSEAANPLWPARQNWHRDPATGEHIMTLSRGQDVWAFGRRRSCYPAGGERPARFFDMNRWPLHLQTPERQALTTGVVFSSSDLDIEYSTEANLAGFYEDEVAEVVAANERLKQELDDVSAQLQLRIEHDEQLRQQQANTYDPTAPFAAAPPPPFPEFGDQKFRFVPGVTEFWSGDTRLQRHALEKKWKARIEVIPEEPRGFFSFLRRRKTQPPPSPNPMEPEVRFPKYTDPQRSRIPRSYPRLPTGYGKDLPEDLQVKVNLDCHTWEPPEELQAIMEKQALAIHKENKAKKEGKQVEDVMKRRAEEEQKEDEARKAKEARRAERKRKAEEKAKEDQERLAKLREEIERATKAAEASAAMLDKDDGGEDSPRGNELSGASSPPDLTLELAKKRDDMVSSFINITPSTTRKGQSRGGS